MITGSNFGSTQGSSTVTFNGVSAGTAGSWSATSIMVNVPSAATTGPVVVTVGGVASNGVGFTVIPVPSITSVSPVSGGAAGQFTISGSGFGAVQGTGAVWLGSAYATATTWNDTQIVAKVASNSTSGTARVQQRGVWSNSVPFTVNTATISTVTPDIGLPGTPVTIAGSGFGGNPGQVWLGTAAGVVQSWSDSQIQATVGAGSTSGNAQVLPLQSGVMSNAVPFTVNLPQIESISPTSGTSGTLVTFTGSGFGSSPGTVWLGSTAGQYQQWTDTLVTAVVAPTALSGIAKIQPSGGAWSNAVGFTVPTSGGISMILTPSMLNMVVGDTHTIQALSSTGQSVTGLSWTSSDKTVVSLSTDDPPVLTAVSAGHVTITAGAASADVTVSAVALAVGTVIWSNPGNGSGVDRIVPAVPSANGVADVFAFQDDGTVQAITSDGTTAWTADVSQAERIIPDFQGGLVAIGQNSIWKLDGITGQPYPAYTPSASWQLGSRASGKLVAVHTDGTIFTLQSSGWPAAPAQSVVGIDPTTGTQKFSVTIPLGPDDATGVNGGGAQRMMIAGDGYAYVPYTYRESTGNEDPNAGALNHLMVLRVNSAGASDNIEVYDWTSAYADEIPITLGGTITNADQGVLLTWSALTERAWSLGMATTAGASASLAGAPQVPGRSLVSPVVQAQDGSYVGAYWAGYDADYNSLYNMVSFDAEGNVRWIVPNEQPQIATDDGGVIGTSGITYDSSGNATGQVSPLTQSWLGNAYQVGSVDQVLANWLRIAASWWPFSDGNASGNRTSVNLDWFPALDDCISAQGCIGSIGHYEAIYNALFDLIRRLGDPAVSTSAQTAVFDKVGTDASGNKLTTASFVLYLSTRRPGFYDGLRSNYCYDALTSSTANALCYVPFVKWALLTSVQTRLANNPLTDAVTATPHNPLRTFFRPSSILFNSVGKNLGNEAMIFHEALHGLAGTFDATLLTELGYSSSIASCNISKYIEANVLTLSSGLDRTTTSAACPQQ